MEDFVLEEGKFTPEIKLNAETGVFTFSGECFPSSRRNFFVPIYDWIEAYTQESDPKDITIIFELSFLDTASTQSFLRILQLLDDYQAVTEGAHVQVQWHYEEGDLDMLGVGQDYQEDVDLDIELIAVEPPMKEEFSAI